MAFVILFLRWSHRGWLGLIALLLSACLAQGAENADQRIVEEILAVDRLRFAAHAKGDLQTLAKLVSEDVVSMRGGVVQKGRQAYLDSIQSKGTTFKDYSIESPTVRCFGEVALVCARFRYFSVRLGRDAATIYTAVFHRTADSWEMVSYIATPIEDAKPAAAPPAR